MNNVIQFPYDAYLRGIPHHYFEHPPLIQMPGFYGVPEGCSCLNELMGDPEFSRNGRDSNND